MMMIAGLLFFSASLLDTKLVPVFAEVYLGNQGPYRFLVDTGSETSLIEPRLAHELALKPQYRVEIASQNTTQLLPGLKVRSLRVGEKTLADVELVLHDLTEARKLHPSIRGLLGMNALGNFSFTLYPPSGRLELAGERPAGEVVAFTSLDGRIALKARMGEESLSFILDSGSNHIVLFRTPIAMAKTHPVSTSFGTLEGARRIVPTCWTADMLFSSRLRVGTLPAAIVERRHTQVDGLLPAGIFKKIYVDQVKSELVLLR